MSLMSWQLSIVCTISDVVKLGRHRLRWKELVECMVWIVRNFIEQFIVSLLQQLIKFWQVRLGEAASLASTHASARWRSVADAGDAYVSRATTVRRLRGRRRAGQLGSLLSSHVAVHGVHN